MVRGTCPSSLRERKNTGFNFQVCNVRFPIVAVYRLTQAGFKQEVNDMTAQLKLPGSGALNFDLIGGTLWLELWDHETVRSRRKHDDLCLRTISELEFGSRVCGRRAMSDHRLAGR